MYTCYDSSPFPLTSPILTYEYSIVHTRQLLMDKHLRVHILVKFQVQISSPSSFWIEVFVMQSVYLMLNLQRSKRSLEITPLVGKKSAKALDSGMLNWVQLRLRLDCSCKVQVVGWMKCLLSGSCGGLVMPEVAPTFQLVMSLQLLLAKQD